MAITSVKSGDGEVKTRVFISYSRKDLSFADRLESALRARGFDVLIDREEIYAFEDWWKRIEALIDSADTVVFALSPDAVRSEVALKEIAHATSLNKRFAPIVCRRVEDSAVPESLRRLNFIFFDDSAHFDASVSKLVAALQTDIGWIRRHTEFGEAARRWIEGGHAGGLLLHPPVLDQAEAWMTFRPGGAPQPTAETEAFIAASRNAQIATRRRSRILNAALYTMLLGIILGLIGWINQSYFAAEWRWWTVTRPYAKKQIHPHVLTAAEEEALKPGDSFKECASDCPLMIVIPAGSFVMGASANEKGHRALEEPQHSVTMAKPFAVSQFEVTFADWDACAAYGNCDPEISDGGWGRGSRPVIDVSWEEAKGYVAWLARMTGKDYRLLSEAEYEYAERAGAQMAYPWGDEIGKDNANCNGCGTQWDNTQTAPVGSFASNRFNLYDMAGNIWELVEDCAHDNYDGAPTDGSAWIEAGNCKSRVARGGAWSNTPDFLRAAARVSRAPDVQNSNLGFRVGRTLGD